METILELQRRYHEERERLLQSMVYEEKFVPRNYKEKINSETRLKGMLDRYLDITETLNDLYDDKDGIRKKDMDSLSVSGTNDFTEFNERLKEIKDYHKKHPGELSVPLSMEFDDYARIRENPLEAGAPIVDFSREEAYGKNLDLHESYNAYINLKIGAAATDKQNSKAGSDKAVVDYIRFLREFDNLSGIPMKVKSGAAFRHYLETLLGYLEGFIRRAKPLHDVFEDEDKLAAEFERDWAAGKLPGWSLKDLPQQQQNQQMTTQQQQQQPTPIDANSLELSGFSSWEELASLGLDRLKSALTALELKCGGTLEERAKRLWQVRGLSPAEIIAQFPQFLNAKKLKQVKNAPAAAAASSNQTTAASVSGVSNQTAVSASMSSELDKLFTQAQKEVARLEFRVRTLMEHLREERASSVDNAQRKQARTLAEIEEEGENTDEEGDNIVTSAADGGAAGGMGGAGDGDGGGADDDETIYNPKNLPLGWDGKPIPYWLYKLHGLNMYFNCQICGDQKYRGPKAFQRHFSEYRHANGMKRLGIPNTAHFAHVTNIAEAQNLWAKLQMSKNEERWKSEVHEEYEDQAGNVISKKTYEDLKRQGLL